MPSSSLTWKTAMAFDLVQPILLLPHSNPFSIQNKSEYFKTYMRPGQRPGLLYQYKAKAFYLRTNPNPSLWLPRPCKMALPNSVGSFIATLPQRSATQPQGLLAAQVGQACLGAFIPAVPAPGMPLSQTSMWPAFSHSVPSSNIT